MTEKTIPKEFYAVAEAYPNNILFHYFRDGWETITYKTFSKEVYVIASYLLS